MDLVVHLKIAHSIDTTRKLEHFSTLELFFCTKTIQQLNPSFTSIFLYTKLKDIIRFYILEMQFYTSHFDRALPTLLKPLFGKGASVSTVGINLLCGSCVYKD